MSALARFQDDFADALYDERAFAPVDQAAFAIYRNTAMRACLDALEANYPAVVCLVGRDWFRAAAALHASQSPPRDGRLFTYGDDFPDFIGTFPPASDMPYLGDVARLDRLWVESLVAADASVLDAATMTTLGPDGIAALRLRVHPATRTFAAASPAVTIWQASRAGVAVGADLVWQPEYAIVTRGHLEVGVAAVEAPVLRFLEAIAEGVSLADAALSTVAIHPDARIDLILASLLNAGAFAT
ncbi:DNA-binding domain-containing protein [Luteibacter sp. dw_328]|uniref:HvfC/BufC N-terminal domain-containing protein n=1 Tax=Luteibacter sp. dw_328 TaxID=2719796 RepID=UPI001BD3F8A3|nr:DNA-binding domain-containing protein [Luteibacter sp. dw_328]